MTQAVRFINPETLSKPPGYTHVVEVSSPGRTIYVAGQLGLKADGSMAGGAGDFRAQAEQAFANLRAALSAVGAGFEHVVKTTNYLTDMQHLPVFREVRNKTFAAGQLPASTTVAISQLAREGALFEVEAIAVVPSR